MTDPNTSPEQVDTEADGVLEPAGTITVDVTYWEEDDTPEDLIGEELTDEELRTVFADDDQDVSDDGPLFELTDEDITSFLSELASELGDDIREASWHLAPSLVRLRAEINRKWPRRDKRSDGSIGDASHSARDSDHNPNGRRSVNAIDTDKDGISPATLVAAAKKHPACNYVIWNRVIYSRAHGFRARRYTGVNPHNHHIHISILQTRSAEQSTRGWLGSVPAPTPPKPPAPRSKYALPVWPFGTNRTKYFAPHLNSKPPVYTATKNVQRKR